MDKLPALDHAGFTNPFAPTIVQVQPVAAGGGDTEVVVGADNSAPYGGTAPQSSLFDNQNAGNTGVYLHVHY